MKNNSVKGYALGIIAAATYGLNPLFALPVYAHGMNPDSVLFFRYIIAIPIIGAMLLMRGHSLKIKASDILPLFVMGIMTGLSSLFLFLSYNQMNAGIASTILFVYPVMVAILMSVCYRERIGKLTVGCMGMALIGIILLYKAPDGATLSLIGTMLVLASALTYAIYIVAANRPRFKRLPTLKMIFYVLLFGTLVFTARLAYGVPFTLPSNGMDWLCVTCLAILPTAVSFACTTAAIQYIGSTPTAILGALEPVTALLVSIAVFNETVTPRDCAGILLIIVAVSVVAAGKEAARWLLRIRKMFPRIHK